MLDIQGPGSLKKISGICNREVFRVKDLRFARKHLTSKKESKIINSIKHIFAFVSSPLIYKDHDICAMVKGWCHGFRDPQKYLPILAPSILLPESDFMDSMFISYSKKQDYKYDFFYFTLNSNAGIKNKGLDVFLKCVDILCIQKKLKGIVIVYFPNVPKVKRLLVLTDKQRRKIENNNNLEFYWGKMNSEQMSQITSQCRFGFFPNTVDNSPRTISETLIRNRPILVNNDIHGGWHYINQFTGELFDFFNISEKIDKIINCSYSPRDYFLDNYGFERSSRKLAKFVQSIVELDKDYSHLYFNNYEHYFMEILKN